MPYLAHLTIKITRKFQLEKDDWVGVDALATVTVEDEEAHLFDPAEVRRMAREQAKLAVMEQLAEEVAERDARRAEQRRQRDQPQQVAAAAYQPPRDPVEAEQRFFARYGETIGGQEWSAVQRYLHSHEPKPITVEGWIAAAEAVRDRTRAQAS